MLDQRCKIWPEKRRFAAYADAEEFNAKQKAEHPEREEQYIYECVKDRSDGTPCCEGFHLTTEVQVEETSSKAYARVLWPVIGTDSDEFQSAGRPLGATSATVEERRQRVLIAVNTSGNKTYKEIAEEMGIEMSTFTMDIRNLIERNLYAGRNERKQERTPIRTSAPALTAAEQLARNKALVEEILAQNAQLEAQAAADEAARIEREKVRLAWTISKDIRVQKDGTFVTYSVDAWREVIAVVSDQIAKFDENLIEFPELDNLVEARR